MTDQLARTPSFFVEAQRALLRSILNRIVPASGAFPGAGDLDIASYIDVVVGRSMDLKWLFAQGMARIEGSSHAQYAQAFAGLSDGQKDAILRHVESANPDFFAALVLHTYSGYYSHPTVIQLLGLELRPPQPGGYQLEPLDLSLLETVKRRAPIYREA